MSGSFLQAMQRYEIKYLMNEAQTAHLLSALRGRMLLDRYGRTPIFSLYYDTPDSRLIRASLEKPAYKEKIRLRSYGPADASSPVFLELKRKAEGVVYKRRVQTSLEKTEAFFSGGPPPEDSQIGREIAFFRDRYSALRPACLIVYDREAYFEPAGDLRLTVDYAPRFRTDRLTLDHPDACAPLLAPGGAILEIKVQQALPLWLSHALDAGEIRKSSFSKYGEAWRLTHAAGTARTGKERKPCLIPSLRLPSPRASFS